ncbi:MAG: hypothetical protein R8L58_05595 [Mariprofundaceae bacterium]
MDMQMRQREQGFSVIKLMLFLGLLGGVVWYGWLLIPIYNAQWKVQDAFDAVSRNMANASEEEVYNRLPELFKIKYIYHNDLPEEFYENIKVKAEGGRIEVSSYYHVTIWPLGPVEDVDPESEYDAAELKGMDKIRDKLRLDFDFEPYAQTP